MTKRRKRIFLVLALLVTAALLGALFVRWYFLSPERLRARVERELARALNANVSVGAARWEWSSGVILSDVAVRDGGAEAPPVLTVAALRAEPAYGRLLLGRLALKRVSVEDAELNVALAPDFGWPFYEKLPKPAGVSAIPDVQIMGSRVHLSMPDAPERFPALEFEGVGVFARDAGGGKVAAGFNALAGTLGKIAGGANIDRATGALDVSVHLVSPELTPALRERLPAAARQAWDDLNPSAGTLQLHALITRAASANALTYGATLALRGGEFHPKGIPFPFQGMNLDVTVNCGKDNRFAVTGGGRSGNVALTADGQGEFRPGKGFIGAATVEAKGIVFNRELFDALPAAVQEVWGAIEPRGMADLRVVASITEEGTPGLRARVALHDAAAAPGALPLELTGLNGFVEWDMQSRRLSTSGIEGRFGGAPFKIAPGHAVLAPDGPLALSLRVDNLLLDHPLKQLAPWLVEGKPERIRSMLDPLRVAGALDVTFSAVREMEKPLRVKCGVHARDLALAHPKCGTIQNIIGGLEYEGEFKSVNGALAPGEWVLRVGGADALWRGARLSLQPFQLSGPADAGWKVEVAARDLVADEQLEALLPDTTLPAWNKFKPVAVADVALTVAREAGRPSGSRTDMTADVRKCSIKYVGFPYPLQNVAGTVTVVDNQFGEAHCAGKNGVASFVVDVARTEDKDRGELHAVHVVADGMPLDQDLYAALPRPYQEFWESFKISGGAFEQLDLKLNVYSPKGRPDVFDFTSAATVSKLRMEKSVPIYVEQGRLAVEKGASDDSGAVTAEGPFYVERAQVERSTLEDLSGFFRWKDGGLSVENIVGRTYEGIISGTIYVAGDRDAEKSFRGELVLHDADVSRVLEAAVPAAAGELSGRLDASMNFAAPLGDAGQFHAAGGMTIRNGTIGRLPGFLDFLNLLVLSKLDSPVFTGLEMAYEMQGALLVVHKLNLTGDFVSLEGTGQVQPDGNLTLTFVPKFGPDLPKIPVISDFLHKILSEVKAYTIPISVSGNYNDPVWQINPLIPVTRIMQGVAGGVKPPKKKAEDR